MELGTILGVWAPPEDASNPDKSRIASPKYRSGAWFQIFTQPASLLKVTTDSAYCPHRVHFEA